MLSWAVPWSVVGDDCLPGGNLFGIIVVVNLSFICGFAVSKIQLPTLPPLPSLLGRSIFVSPFQKKSFVLVF